MAITASSRWTAARSGITIGGSANANLGCGVISNSTSTAKFIGITGNAYNLVASPVAAAGGMPASSTAQATFSRTMRRWSTRMPGITNIRPWCTTCKPMAASKQMGNDKPGCYNDFNRTAGHIVAGRLLLEQHRNQHSTGNNPITGAGRDHHIDGERTPDDLSINGKLTLDSRRQTPPIAVSSLEWIPAISGTC